MVIHTFKCCDYHWEDVRGDSECPKCGNLRQWSGMVQRENHGLDLAKRMQTGYKIEPDLSPQQQAYIETPEVQAKMKTGEYAVIQRGSDAWNHR